MMNILVLDDEKEIADLVEVYLKNENYNVYKFYNSDDSIKCIDKEKIDMAILDIMINGKNGFQICKYIRDKGLKFPIIMLTAKIEDNDKIKGLTLGADDYITKPFNPLELVARVNSSIRRYVKLGSIENSNNNEKSEKIYKVGELELNDDTKKVIADGKDIKLTATEYNILKFLLKNKGKVYSISEIYENVWNEDSLAAENIIAVHIRHIREKIEINPKEPKYLKVIWGIGYKIEDIK